MKNVRIAFELYEGNVEDLTPGYQELSCHIIFNVNMGDNYRRKSWYGSMRSQFHNTVLP